MIRLMRGVWLLSVIASATAWGEGASGYRFSHGTPVTYLSKTGAGRVKVTPAMGAGLFVSIATQRPTQGSSPGSLEGAIRVSAETGGERRYAGPIDSIFEVGSGEVGIYVEYPDTDVMLTLKGRTAERGFEIQSAQYQGGCKQGISNLADEYLSHWVGSLPKRIEVPRGDHLVLEIPHPSQEAGSGKRSYRRDCASIGGLIQNPYVLRIDAKPDGSAVYIDGRMVSGKEWSIKSNTVSVLVRHTGCQDYANTVKLGEAKTTLTVTLGGCSR